MTDPREPLDTDSAVEGTDLDDARFEQRGTADVETGAGETGAAEGSSDTADLAIDDDKLGEAREALWRGFASTEVGSPPATRRHEGTHRRTKR